jgi:hypothetical protein
MHAKASRHVFDLRLLLGLAVLLTEVVFANALASAGLAVVLSSAVVTVALLIQLRFGVRANAATPADIVVFIFNWLFLDLAPKVQLISIPQQLVNTSPVDVDNLAMTNLVCALFMVTFTFVYAFLSHRGDVSDAREAAPRSQQPQFTARAIGVAVFVCIAVVGVAAPFAYRSVDTVMNSPALLVMNRFLLFLPSATLLILLNETLRSDKKIIFSRACVLVLLLVLVVITENPYTEKRNALGPVYIGLMLVTFQNWFASRNKRLMLLVFSMVLVFPASMIFTHNHNVALSDLSFREFGDQIADHYFSINYDSWANVYTAVEIARVHGVQWGHQLLGSMLFFVPSAIWTTKPSATGIFLGNYLIAHYSMWFNNLSAPLVAEGFLDFGYVGAIGYAVVMALIVTGLNKLALRKDKWFAMPLAMYASIFLMIVMRGSLMIAMGFATAAFLSFLSASALLSMRLGVRHRRVYVRQVRPDPTLLV